ncbi:MAG: lipid-A-disaccharide synthase [Acidobacteria bacterium]|nr:MAG: lipid-A-disaccharide synthase [Acidobacteriota bacterium]
MTRIPVLISAGEASGDMYAARLALALRRRTEVDLFGMGGPRMREAGVDTVVDAADVGVLGVVEIVRKLPALRRAWKRLISEIERRGPRLAILTDFPAFHLRLSRVLRRKHVRNIYFVCPQFWAWRPWRVRLVKRRFVRGLCIFPFEEDFYRKAGVQTDWIGHPLVDAVRAPANRETFAARYGLDTMLAIVAVLPGSRPSELAHHMPQLMAAVAQMNSTTKRQFVFAAAPGLTQAQLKAHMAGLAPAITTVENATYELLGAAQVAIVSSGTATIEAALLGVPMVVVYRVAPFTAWVVRHLVHTRFFAMVNVLAGKEIVPELIQDAFTTERVVRETERLLASAEARETMRRELAGVREKLGPPGAIERAADIIAEMIRNQPVT